MAKSAMANGLEVEAPDNADKHRNESAPDPVDREDKWFKLFKETPIKGVVLFATLTLAIGIPTLVYLTAFAGMGYGEQVFTHTREHNEKGASERLGLSSDFGPSSLGGFLAGVVMCTLITLYLLDAELWEDPTALRVRRAILTMCGFLTVLGIIYTAADYPFGPLCLLLMGLPVMQVITYRAIMRFDPHWMGATFPTGFRDFLIFLPEPFILIGVITLASWLGWVIHKDNEWSTAQQRQYAENLDCPEHQDCLGGFLLWISPLLCASVLFFYAGFAYTFRPGRKQSELKMLGASTGLVMIALWVASSLAGVSEGLTSGIFFFALAALIGVGITVALMSEGGWQKIFADMKNKGKDAVAGVDPDWIRALFMITAGPLVLLFLPVSALNQYLRKCMCLPCTKVVPHDSEEWNYTLTGEMQARIDRVRVWNWTSVGRKIIWIGVGYQLLSVVVSQFTVLFLAWMNEAVSSWSLGAIVGITISVGLILFLLPPVPGAPIYVTAGILIPSAGEDSFGAFGAVILAILVSLATKLMACFLQQVAIGGTLAGKVWIRQICMVNTSMIKCFRLILQEPSLTVSKVGILVGGPDWPTSVLCGILKIPLLQTMIGTLPAIVLIAPCTLTGALYYYSGKYPDSYYGTLAVISGMIGAGVQSGSLVVATFYVDKILRDRKDEVDAIPDDEEVKMADDRERAINKQREEAVEWPRLQGPNYFWMRFVLKASVFMMVFSCWVVTILPGWCFRSFELTDTIDEKLGGRAWTLKGDKGITRPLGNAVLLLFFMSCCGLWLFVRMSNDVASLASSVDESTGLRTISATFNQFLEEGKFYATTTPGHPGAKRNYLT
uniref:Uncharacterized protein n=1 Tax=Phaeomonas parva TaxID=124430 RepID=A0A6U4J9U0_9STRA|mmetsp:Transcript_40790/g.127629  ORF Transcript_40790/g.127629 Transcript_40790/m.127629 type:complete len:838 (+) Transcript_40790:225-2738(+)